jgi:hypothetical protein
MCNSGKKNAKALHVAHLLWRDPGGCRSPNRQIASAKTATNRAKAQFSCRKSGDEKVLSLRLSAFA